MTTSDLIIEDILNKIDTKYFIDIGSSCHTEESQSELLLNYEGWSGLMFECNYEKHKIQVEKMTSKNVKVILDKVTPNNILDILEKENVPDNFFLSLDIDGYDYYVLEKILSKYNPKLIISEINEKIPPPIKFTVNFNDDIYWTGGHYYGYSISMLEGLLSTYNYKIKSLEYNNVILEPGKQEESIEEIYNNGYLNREYRKTLFHYNSDFEEIYEINSVDDKISFIKDKFLNKDYYIQK
jgi:hypothetical protein